MPQPLRYSQPTIQQHLAQQYVLNQLSTLTALRMESLMRNDSKLTELVYRWEENLTPIIEAIPSEQPPQRVWKALENQHGLRSSPTHKQINKQSNKLKTFSWLWPSAFACSLVVTLVLSMKLYQASSPATAFTPSYTALMANPNNQQRFIINAYKGLTPGHSQIKIVWDKSSNTQDLSKLTLWSINRKDGVSSEISNAGSLFRKDHFLSKKNWLLIKDSAFLEIRQDKKVIFRGECIQLAALN